MIRQRLWLDEKDWDIIGLVMAKKSAIISHPYAPLIVRKGTILPIVSFEEVGIWIRFLDDESYFIHYDKEFWEVKFVEDIFDIGGIENE